MTSFLRLSVSCFSVALALTLSACSSTPRTPDWSAKTPSSTPDEVPDTAYRPIPVDTLYALLVAEIAGQRQRYDVALFNYLDQARRLRDPDIAERAARIGQFVGAPGASLEAVGIWLEQDPDNPNAHQAAAQLLIEQGQFEQAFSHLAVLQQNSGLSQYDYLAAGAGHLPPARQQEILDYLLTLKQQSPRDASLLNAIAIMNQHLERYEEALTYTEKALEVAPKHMGASLQRARILLSLKRYEDAASWISTLRRQYPEHKGLRIMQARTFIDLGEFSRAQQGFAALHQDYPEDAAILLSLALLEEEVGMRAEAREHFYQLLATQEHTNEAHFYLGRIAQEEDALREAVDHFSQVSGGREYLPAQLNATQLWFELDGLDAAREHLQSQRQLHPNQQINLTRIEMDLLGLNNQPKEAIILANDIVTLQPNNPELRYTRAMLAERIDDLKLAEADLRHILSLEPQHADALNALGYILANRQNRLEEALPLVQQANELRPDTAAIMDSLGWVYFLMGNIDQAKLWLERAYLAMPDHEIAAHYGELLWAQGQTEQALHVWQQGLEHQPNSPVILSTLKRLNVSIQQLWPPKEVN